MKTYTFHDGSPEEWLKHVKTFRKILKGQNITTGEAAFAMLRRLLKGKMLANLERIYVEEAYTATVANTTLMTAKLTELLFPDRALQKQRRGMRRYVQKMPDVSTSSLYAHLVEMNEQLIYFLGGSEDLKLSEDKMKEILEFSLPN